MNLTDANEKGEATWHLSHKATELFNVTDMSEIEKMTQIDVEGEYIMKRYADSATEKQMHDKKEIQKAKCAITTDSYNDYVSCAEAGVISVEFYYSIINDISGEWGKKKEK